MVPEKLIIDCDTGVDDALALAVVASCEPIEVLGITTCGGNVGLDKTTENTLKVLEFLNCRWPVFKGEEKNLDLENFIFAPDYHGPDGLWQSLDYSPKRKSERKSESKPAWEFIIDSVHDYPDEITVLAIAPVTNLAKAIKTDPEIALRLKAVYLMAGAIGVPGNEGLTEFNALNDPRALSTVINSSVPEIFLIPLDATHQVTLAPEEVEENLWVGVVSDWFERMFFAWHQGFGAKKSRLFELYDPLAAGAMFGDFVEFCPLNIEIVTEGIERGRTRVSPEGREVCVGLNVEVRNFKTFFWSVIKKLDLSFI